MNIRSTKFEVCWDAKAHEQKSSCLLLYGLWKLHEWSVVLERQTIIVNIAQFLQCGVVNPFGLSVFF